ncbi:TonB-dependent receptor [Sphingomonas sp.]|uniref:TonB-dependent receptor domain-containing protein n=1 Tax=Sphingomonas sp. TaxID=28214 RepID=UPI000DB1E584|nr:TonB-dependent receptor [Sphingomonas sp.]PZU09747.1 MAG: TonB-dependent receptor [Sphingomonas sp.]
MPGDATFAFNIGAGSATATLATVAEIAGVSIAWPSSFPQMRLRGLHGRMPAGRALDRLLAGTGYHAVRVGPTDYRVEPLPRGEAAPVEPSLALSRLPPPEPVAADILVTGQKRLQNLAAIPASIAVVDFRTIPVSASPAVSRDVASDVEGLALTNLGPGRNRQFIRGVADSPFNGPSQSTVGVQLDEARVTFDAPDPDIRLIDVERVEILKGPQGPLYGSGALGGIYHVVTRKPDLDQPGATATLSASAVQHGSPGGSGEAVLNLPVIDGALGVRGVGYVGREGGWIDNAGRNHNANKTNMRGGRLALRWQADPDWTVDLSGIVQDVNVRDSQYVTASRTIDRTASIAEPTDNDFKSAALTVQGRAGGARLLATTSYVDHGVSSILDSSSASAAFGLTGQSSFADDRHYRIFNGEIRLSDEGDRIGWLAGLSYLDTHSRNTGTISAGGITIEPEALDRKITEAAAFGELGWHIDPDVEATVGVRVSRSIAENEAIEQEGGGSDRISKWVASPSVALSWAPSSRSLLYLRYARALRPGGLALAGETTARRYSSDRLGSLELSVRHSMDGGRLALNGSLFHTNWSHIQSDYLRANGLISTRNAGDGRINGVEASGDWKPARGLTVSAGFSYVDAHLIRTEDGTRLEDTRLPVTPDVTARALFLYQFALGSWRAGATAQINYTGRARLTFDQVLDRTMGDYATASAGGSLSRSGFTLVARIDNLADVKGDSFAFGNPFSIADGRQYTPLRPRTFTLAVTRAW